MRYRWEVKTGDVYLAGTDADIFLSLAGLDDSMREVQITDPDDMNDFEQNDVNHGTIETTDLGELQTGNLRHNNWGGGPGWYVDYVKVTSEEDGREWTAQVGKWDEGGRFPMLRFQRTSDGNFAQVQRQKEEKARKELEQSAEEKRKADEAGRKRRRDDDDARAKSDQDETDAELNRQLDAARKEEERSRKQAEIAKLKAKAAGATMPTPTPAGGGMGGAFRTYEIFAVVGGGVAPLSRALSGGRLIPGARVMVGEAAGEGFSLAGMPGAWNNWYAGRSPAEWGLDADKGVLGSDGTRGYVLTASFLASLLGPSWRTAIYS